MIKYSHNYELCIQFTVAMPTKVEEYALVFLQMFNNARENPDMIYKLENNPTNTVFITCPTEYKEAVESWIKGFNNTKVVWEEEVDRYVITADYDNEGWEELFQTDNEVQFAVDIE